MAIAAAFASWGVSSAVYPYNDVTALGVLFGGMLSGVCMMFYVCAHLTIGTATGRAGLSATICIVASLLLPTFFSAVGSGITYNPFTLNVLAGSIVTINSVGEVPLLEIIITLVFTLAIMAVLYSLALFAQNAKKIDNSGNEIRI